MAEILYLDVQYDYEAELDRLKSYRRLYPYDDSAANYLGWLYLHVLDDPVSAEPHLRAAYHISPDDLDLQELTLCLFALRKGDEIAEVARDYRTHTGQEPTAAILFAFALRKDW